MTVYKLNLFLLFAALVLAVMFMASGLIPIDSFWGFNHLMYHDDPFILLIFILLLAGIVPSLNKLINTQIGKLSTAWNRLPVIARAILIAVISGILFYFLRVHVHSLGDGYQRIYQIEKGYVHYYSEPLDFYLHAKFYQVLNGFGKVSGGAAYNIFSIIVGMIFTVSVYLFRLPKEFEKSGAAIKLLILTLGGSQLFFGYVESYGLVYIFSLLYLLYASRFIYEEKGLTASSVMISLAVLSHMTGFILMPSFVYLLYISIKKSDPKTNLIPVIIGLIPVVYYIGQAIWLKKMAEKVVRPAVNEFLPILKTGEYSILSGEHLADILNQFLLICPIIVIVILAIILYRKKVTADKSRAVFGWVVLIPALAMILFLDPKLGYARDWDLFAMPTALVFTGLLLFFGKLIDVLSETKYLRTMLGTLSAIFFISFIVMNSSTDSQLTRAEDLLKLSSKGRGYSTELLAEYYQTKANDNKKAIELLESIKGNERNARVYSKLARAFLDQHDDEDALKAIYGALMKDSTATQMNYLAGITWLKLKKPERALPHLWRSQKYEPNQYNVFYSIGNAYYWLDSLEMAVEAYTRCTRIDTAFAPAYYEAANMYIRLGKYDSAVVYAREGMKLNPNYPGGTVIYETAKSGLGSGQNH